MVTVCLAIGGDVAKLRPVALIGECVEETVRELFAIIQQAFESHRPGNRAVVKEEIDGAPGRQLE